jgi:hypothetical protein
MDRARKNPGDVKLRFIPVARNTVDENRMANYSLNSRDMLFHLNHDFLQQIIASFRKREAGGIGSHGDTMRAPVLTLWIGRYSALDSSVGREAVCRVGKLDHLRLNSGLRASKNFFHLGLQIAKTATTPAELRRVRSNRVESIEANRLQESTSVSQVCFLPIRLLNRQLTAEMRFFLK